MQVLPLVHNVHSSYVIDFYLASDNSIKIVELNPFVRLNGSTPSNHPQHIGAGACLFSWKENRDLFLNGPFEFRIIEVCLSRVQLLLTLSAGSRQSGRRHPFKVAEDTRRQISTAHPEHAVLATPRNSFAYPWGLLRV